MALALKRFVVSLAGAGALSAAAISQEPAPETAQDEPPEAAAESVLGPQPDPNAAAAPTPVLTLPAAPEADAGALLRQAETYASFYADVEAAGARELASGEDLDAVMDALAAYYGDDRLADSQIAYGALVAARHPEFIDAVRALADYYGLETTAQGLLADPAFVMGFFGADTASETVIGALSEDAAEIRTVGHRYRMAAYDLQSEGWANRTSGDRDARLEAINSGGGEDLEMRLQLGAQRLAEAVEDGLDQLGPASALNGERLGAPAPALTLNVGEAQLTPDQRRVGRILAVAALQAVEGGSDDPARMETMLTDAALERCINWARLHLAQCVAAGHFKYEDSYCIGEHALNDVAACLSATGAPAPIVREAAINVE